VVPHHTKAVSQISAGALLAPIHIPSKPAEIIDDEPLVSSGPGVRGGVVGGVENGVPGGVLSSIIDQGRPFVPPPQTVVHETPKTAPAPVVVAKAPVRISQLQLATPIRKVEPVYPYLAKQAHISGTVELVGVLGTDGRIHELHVVSGHPLLIQAAVDAVKQWIFAPTILNGQAVEVQAPIQVRFVLSH
jgi:protein TonB